MMTSEIFRKISAAKDDTTIVSLTALAQLFPSLRRAPRTILLLTENLMRNAKSLEEGLDLLNDIEGQKSDWLYRPYRVVMQDAAGIPALVDIAGLRDHAVEQGRSPSSIDVTCQSDLIVDHSISTVATGPGAAAINLASEYRENAERYEFLRWSEQAFRRVRIFPPGTGIIHQVNLESISVLSAYADGWLFPESLIGTDSHTPMINGLGILGWGAGGLEATAVMLGQSIQVPPPRTVAVNLIGRAEKGVLMADVALRLTERLRKEGVVDHFLEFMGPGLDALKVPDRATIANMTPEYGATCSLFPVDDIAIDYLRTTGRSEAAQRTSLYLDAEPMLSAARSGEATFERQITFDIGAVPVTVAGPRFPHEARRLADVPSTVSVTQRRSRGADRPSLSDGDIVLAAITSCTNTSNPAAMIVAGLVARNADRLGLKLQMHIKGSFSPGSRAVPAYLDAVGLLDPLQAIGFWLAGFGCMTCVGNSGDFDDAVVKDITSSQLNVAAVLSGNRNFEGRIHPLVRSAYLMSPPLVVAYALAGSMLVNLQTEPIAKAGGRDVYLSDLWPDDDEVAQLLPLADVRLAASSTAAKTWADLPGLNGPVYPWRRESTYFVRPQFDGAAVENEVLPHSVPLAIFGDSVTTDHISPVGRISAGGPAGQYLRSLGVAPKDFNTFGARRGNAQVMRRGMFDNPRLQNKMAGGAEGNLTHHIPSGDIVPIFEAAERYRADGMPVVIVAGEDYGKGSARDWAAKGTRALGVRAVLARSFERIHRANLALVGVMPLQWKELPPLRGDERFQIAMPPSEITPRSTLDLSIYRDGRIVATTRVLCRLDTLNEVECWRAGGFFSLVAKNASSIS